MDARREFIHLLSERLDESGAAKALEAFDMLALHYNITPNETALTTCGSADEPILLYFIESCKLDGIKDSTMRNKSAHLRKFLNSVNAPIGAITPLHCRAYMAMVAEQKGAKGDKITAGTYNSIRSDINSFFEWCMREELIQKNPMINIRRRKETREVKKSISGYEIEQLRRAAETKQERLMIEIMLGTGCRISELRLLKTSDLDFRNGEVLLYGVKTNEYRKSITNVRMEVAYDEFMWTKSNDSPYLFASQSRCWIKTPVSTRYIEKMFQKICARAGIKRKIRPHDTRRTFATVQAKSGTDVVAVQHLLGHKSLNTTQCYIDTTKIDYAEARRHCA